MAQAAQYHQNQQGHQTQYQKEQIFGHGFPPPVKNLGVEENDKEGDARIGRIPPALAYPEPDRQGGQHKAQYLVSALDQMTVQVQIATIPPVGKHQDRQEQGQQARDTVSGRKAGKTVLIYKTGDQENYQCSRQEVLRTGAHAKPVHTPQGACTRCNERHQAGNAGHQQQAGIT